MSRALLLFVRRIERKQKRCISFCVWCQANVVLFKEVDSRTLKRGCANRQILLRTAKIVDLEKVDGPKLGHACEMAWWNWLACLICPQSAESVDWGHPTLNRPEGVLGVNFVTQLKGYPNFNFVTNFVLIGGDPLRKNDPSRPGFFDDTVSGEKVTIAIRKAEVMWKAKI